MPFFQASCEVSGLELYLDDGSSIAGYFCTVVFWSRECSNKAVEQAALNATKQHWARNEFLGSMTSTRPYDFRIDACWQIGFLRYMWHRFIRYNAGATYYPAEEPR